MPSYTAAEKENALRLCDEIGVNKASKETGISRHTLYRWRSGGEDEIATTTAAVDEISVAETDAEEKDTSPSRESKGSGTRYSAEEKEKALRLCDEVGVTKASKMTGITINSLRKWRMDAKNEIHATIVPVKEIPVEETDAEQSDAQADNESTCTNIIARLTKTPVEEAGAEEQDPQPSLQNTNGDEGTSEELIRLRLENATLKAQMAALKNALRMFTE